jgi:hypothetical protein
MSYYPSREELKSDIKEITEGLLETNNRKLVRMVNEDLEVTESRIDRLERRTKLALNEHKSDPHAHQA